LKRVLEADVLKRDVLEGDKAITAKKQVTRAARRAQREKEHDKDGQGDSVHEELADAVSAPIDATPVTA
jgi:hypothetical protein